MITFRNSINFRQIGFERSRLTVYYWVQKTDLQPHDAVNPNHVAIYKTVIPLNDERFWLYAVVDPATNRLLHVNLFPT